MLTKRPIAIVDIETTGPRYKEEDKIIQIAAVIYEEGVIQARHSMLINPERPIPVHIAKLTGITQEAVKGAPTFEQVAGLWYERLKDCLFVAHNINFDLNFLIHVFNENGFDFDPLALDSVKLAKLVLPTAKAYKLSELAGEFDMHLTKAHDALADAEMTLYIVDQLARRVLTWPKPLLDRITEISHYLSHNEHIFFEEAQSFTVQEVCQAKRNKVEKTPNISKAMQSLNKSLATWIIDEWVYPYLVIEDRNFPISKQVIEEVASQLIKDNKNFLLAVNSYEALAYWQESFELLGYKEHVGTLYDPYMYIDPKRLERLNQQLSLTNANQTELLTLGAALVWEAFTQSGNLLELSQEFNIKQLISRYVPQDKTRLSSYYYAALNSEGKKPYILMTHTDILKHHKYSNVSLPETLLVTHLDAWLKALRSHLSRHFFLSESFMELKSYSHYRQLHKLLNALEEILALVEASLLKEEVKEEDTYVNVFRSSQSAFGLALISKCKYVSYLCDDLVHLTALPPALINALKQLRQQVRHIYKTGETDYWIISGRIIRDKVYHMTISIYPLQMGKQVDHFLGNYQRALCFSHGNFKFQEAVGIHAWLNCPKLAYRVLPKIERTMRLTVQIPLEYTPRGEELPQCVTALLEDPLLLKEDHLVFVTNSMKQTEDVYHAIKKADTIMSEYLVLAQGQYGSLNKIIRSAKEAERAIIIMQFADFLDQDFSYFTGGMSLILCRLPFMSPHDIVPQIIAHYDKKLPLFDAFILPEMIQALKEFLMIADELQLEDSVYLLDDRVLTRSYSAQIRKQIQSSINFEIID